MRAACWPHPPASEQSCWGAGAGRDKMGRVRRLGCDGKCFTRTGMGSSSHKGQAHLTLRQRHLRMQRHTPRLHTASETPSSAPALHQAAGRWRLATELQHPLAGGVCCLLHHDLCLARWHWRHSKQLAPAHRAVGWVWVFVQWQADDRVDNHAARHPTTCPSVLAVVPSTSGRVPALQPHEQRDSRKQASHQARTQGRSPLPPPPAPCPALPSLSQGPTCVGPPAALPARPPGPPPGTAQ